MKQGIYRSNEFINTFAMLSTLDVWPSRSAILTIEGYFQRVSWLSLKPWALRSSLSCVLHSSEQTCEPVSTEFKHAPVLVFQNLMWWSPMPPPEARRLLWNGHQERAFTAAEWSSNWWSHWLEEFEGAMDADHMFTRLSLPPLAKCMPEELHFRPHTSCLCPLYVLTMWDRILTSLLMIIVSIPPLVRMWSLQSSELTLRWCPPWNILNCKQNIHCWDAAALNPSTTRIDELTMPTYYKQPILNTK